MTYDPVSTIVTQNQRCEYELVIVIENLWAQVNKKLLFLGGQGRGWNWRLENKKDNPTISKKEFFWDIIVGIRTGDSSMY